jgi:hypothetical protein
MVRPFYGLPFIYRLFRMDFVGNSPFFVFMGNASIEKEPARSAADGI